VSDDAPGRQRSAPLVLLLVLVLALVSACGGSEATSDADAPDGTEAGLTDPPEEEGEEASPAPLADFCVRVGDMRRELADVLAVPRRVANRPRLDDELGELEAAHSSLLRADRGPARDTLELPMRELRYRVLDMRLAVEDFRTTSRPPLAAEHIERQGRALGAALDRLERVAECEAP
jgi:hypothetical protein